MNRAFVAQSYKAKDELHIPLLFLSVIFCFWQTSNTGEPLTAYSRENKKTSLLTSFLKEDLPVRIPFSFEKKSLLTLLTEVAKLKGFTLMLHIGAGLDTLKKELITYQSPLSDDILLDQAWSLVETFLKLSGFDITLQSENCYLITDVTIVFDITPQNEKDYLITYVNAVEEQQL